MSATSVYIDSNVFISPIIYEGPKRTAGPRRVLRMVESGEVTAFTSTLTWDEVVWVVRRFLGRPDSAQAGERLMLFPNLRFVPVSEDVIRQAQRLVSEKGMAPRDAIHATSALSKGVDWFISDDPDLDVVKGLRRQDSSSFRPRSQR